MVGPYLINLLKPLCYSRSGTAETTEIRLQFTFRLYDFLISLIVYFVHFICKSRRGPEISNWLGQNAWKSANYKRIFSQKKPKKKMKKHMAA